MMESKTDVLIIDAGPAGLMAALWLSRLGVQARIIDKRNTGIYQGQADGLHVRTLEILESFGCVDDLMKIGARTAAMAAWSTGKNGNIERERLDTEFFRGFSRFPTVTLNQGFVEKTIVNSMLRNGTAQDVQRGVLPVSLEIDKSQAASSTTYPVRVVLQHLREDEKKSSDVNVGLSSRELAIEKKATQISAAQDSNTINKESYETVHAKYVLGCDGAHSWTRNQIGVTMEGESTDIIWGVMDIIPLTNFPDFRKMATVQSPHGSMLIIPRERNLVRFYVQLMEVPTEKRSFDKSRVNPASIHAVAKKILAPYTLEYKYCDWWTGYRIGQRLGSRYTDENNRVFLAGDAVHTHSPKGGQGMNVSMGDTYDLTWKLAAVINGTAYPDILSTYELERRTVAQELLDFDVKIARVYSGTPDTDELYRLYTDQMKFLSGTGHVYGSNMLIASTEQTTTAPSSKAKTHLATNLTVGKYFPNALVYFICNWEPCDFQTVLESNGRWRLVIFAGDLADEPKRRRLNNLGDALASPSGLLEKFALTGRDHEARLIEVFTIVSGTPAIEANDFHRAFYPLSEETGYEYEKLFIDVLPATQAPGTAYDEYGVDRSKGCMVLVRPDQIVAHIVDLEDANILDEFLSANLIPRSGVSRTTRRHQPNYARL